MLSYLDKHHGTFQPQVDEMSFDAGPLNTYKFFKILLHNIHVYRVFQGKPHKHQEHFPGSKLHKFCISVYSKIARFVYTDTTKIFIALFFGVKPIKTVRDILK